MDLGSDIESPIIRPEESLSRSLAAYSMEPWIVIHQGSLRRNSTCLSNSCIKDHGALLEKNEGEGLFIWFWHFP